MKTKTKIGALLILYSAFLSITIAQWDVYVPWSMEGALITDFALIRCGEAEMLVASTTKGIFVDPTATALPDAWVNISKNVANRSFTSIAVKDSLIFVADSDGGVYATVLSPTTIPPCTPQEWIPWNNGIGAYKVQQLLVFDSLLIAASSNGLVYQIIRTPTTATLSDLAQSNYWKIADTAHTPFLYCVAALPQGTLAGSNLEGSYYYDPRCFAMTSASCSLYNVTPLHLQPFTSYAVAAMNFPTITYTYPTNFQSQARGFLIGGGEGRNLYFAPVLYDSLYLPPQLWIDISPSKYNTQWYWQVLSILPIRISPDEAAILVGTRYGGVLYTTDGGVSWARLNNGESSVYNLSSANVRKLFQLNDTTIIAAMDGGTLGQSPVIGVLITSEIKSAVTAIPQTAMAPFSALMISADNLHFTLPENSHLPCEISLYSVTGDLLQKQQYYSRTGILPLAQLSRGLYLCIIRSGQQLWQKYIFKQ